MRAQRIRGRWISGSTRRLHGYRMRTRTGFGARLAPCAIALLSLFLVATSGQTRVNEVSFFRIGTGSAAGTYFSVGGIIASAISSPPGSRACGRGGACGVPGLIAVAQSTNGSVDNVDGIARGQLESGLSQADVAFWANTGTGIYQDKGAIENLRAIANLYPETLHLVVRRGLDVRTVGDLRGKRISADRQGSGTRVDAMLVLDAYGLGPGDLEILAVAQEEAADMLRAGELDGFFLVIGTPSETIAALADDSLVSLVAIDGPEAKKLIAAYPFFSPDDIVSGTYFNVPFTSTLSVGAQWLVSSDLSERQVYEITRALWHENTRRLLDGGHPKGRLIRIETALDGLGVPLHPGAERYYRENGLLANGSATPSQGIE